MGDVTKIVMAHSCMLHEYELIGPCHAAGDFKRCVHFLDTLLGTPALLVGEQTGTAVHTHSICVSHCLALVSDHMTTVGWMFSGVADDSQSISDPDQHKTQYHVTTCAVLGMIHRPNNYWSVGVLWWSRGFGGWGLINCSLVTRLL